jgi:hypothetical protein
MNSERLRFSVFLWGFLGMGKFCIYKDMSSVRMGFSFGELGSLEQGASIIIIVNNPLSHSNFVHGLFECIGG